ncbi:MAG: diguanylate cyclase [Betaproteobacteria bacterium]|nr:MAG: diguanylate cyclase [Betaproteobacteria bacterium]
MKNDPIYDLHPSGSDAAAQGADKSIAPGKEQLSYPALLPRRGSRFVKRMYWPRIVGMGLALVMVAAALRQVGAPPWAWGLMVVNGLLWPHIAYLWAIRSDSPYDAEHRNLLFDSACGGFWLVAIGFNLVPSVLMLTMLCMNNVSVGGARLLFRGLMSIVIGALVGLPLFGGYLELASSLHVIVASIPFMVTYPVFVGVISYRLSQQLSQQKRRFEALSQRDALSGLATRGYWEIRLNEEFSRARRHSRPATLVLADIDYFKRINDTHGHLLGDTVIRLIGGLLEEQTRAVDFVGRYGGDEFALVLPETPVGNALKVAQRIQTALAEVTVSEQPGFSMTVSIGIAELSPQVSSPREWMSWADQALYEAKSSGRNCIRIFDGDIAKKMAV